MRPFIVPSILIFDSGVGGLSILQHVQQQLPNCHIDYLADHGAYPYGEKQEDWLINHCQQLILPKLKDHDYDILIIACNTASTLVLPSLRNATNTPIIGVVPAIKTAQERTLNKHIGLLATPGTVSRQYMNDLIEEFASDCNVTRVGSTQLVHLAEDKLQNKPVDPLLLKQIIQPFINKQCDQVVLGCTHFPLLLEDLKALNNDIHWVDSGAAIAKRAQYLLKQTTLTSTSSEQKLNTFYSTAKISKDLMQNITPMGFMEFETLAPVFQSISS